MKNATTCQSHVTSTAITNDPGGFRTHDLRIKRSLAASYNSYSHSAGQSRASLKSPDLTPEWTPTDVRSASLGLGSHRADVSMKLPQPNQKKEKISKSTRDRPRRCSADASLINDKFNGTGYYRPESR